MNYKRTRGGLYLVVDPSMQVQQLLTNIRIAVENGVQLLQIWNHWPAGIDKQLLVEAIINICRPASVPVIINEDAVLFEKSEADGIHFDSWQQAEKNLPALPTNIITGITCSNDLHAARWAQQNQLSYISFCSVFPSVSAGACEIVDPAVIAIAASGTDLDIFISGGITPENLRQLPADAKFSGVAVISGIMSSSDPKTKIHQYITNLNHRIHDPINY